MVFVVLVDGFEEIEAICTIDILRRAGIDVITAGLGGGYIKGSHGVIIKSDIPLGEMNVLGAELIVLPGGPGSQTMLGSELILKSVKKAYENDIKIGAICAAPAVLAKAGVLSGKNATIYTGMQEDLKDAVYLDEDVVVDGNIITGRGPALAIKFALELVRQLRGQAAMEEAEKKLLLKN